MLLFTIN